MNPKQAAAEYGASLVKSGMVLGLGSGTTATLMVQAVGKQLREGTLRNVIGVPSSSGIATVAREAGVPLVSLDDHPTLDLNLDGADEVDASLGLIKGLGGALLWEKIVATASRQVAIMVDESKLVSRLGSKAPLPVEVVPFGWRTHLAFVESLGGKPSLRTESDGRPFVTDEGNYIFHCRFENGIADPRKLEAALLTRAGIVATGLFLAVAHQVIVGKADGVEVLRRKA